MQTEIPINNFYTVAFYNLENLFDFREDPSVFDNSFLPNSERNWTKKRYEQKIFKLGQVISQIGEASDEKIPTIIGLAEVENKLVLHDLTQSKHLRHHNYGFVHFDSKDERGVDVALLYDRDVFTVGHTQTYSVYLEKDLGVQDYTRDILLVTGILNKETVHFIVNHWPSRGEGMEISALKRLAAAKELKTIVDLLTAQDETAKIVVMGDFNDNPTNESLQYLSNQTALFNTMETLRSYSRGSLNHHSNWHLFDQILISTNFFETKANHLKFDKSDIFDPQFLKQYKGRFKGRPFRTFVGTKYKGGFSDHFPVYLRLKSVTL